MTSRSAGTSGLQRDRAYQRLCPATSQRPEGRFKRKQNGSHHTLGATRLSWRAGTFQPVVTQQRERHRDTRRRLLAR